LLQLDVLRGIAVGMVLLNHLPSRSANGWVRMLSAPFNMAYWSGVDLFFVLSGYLVGGLLISELSRYGRIDLKRFWLRRGLKIWPSYYLYLAVLVLLTALFYVDHTRSGAQRAGLMVNAPKVIYLQNYFNSSKLPYTSLMIGNHTWTLAVEEHFYFLLPLTLVAAGRRWRTVIPAAAFLLLIGCLAIRVLTYHEPMDWVWDHEVTHKRIDSLFWGVFLVYLMRERPEFAAAVGRHRGAVLATGLLLITPMFVEPLKSPFVVTLGFSLLALGYGCILLAFVSVKPHEGVLGKMISSLPSRALAWLGFWSYSIYLWHYDLIHLFTYLGSTDSDGASRASSVQADTMDLGYLIASVALGALMGHLIEGPVLAWRDRRFPSHSGRAPQSATSSLT
jgi:peptidoglycan/LPS O-acetylase OafA/YrhL